MIYYLPLELLDERYTISFDRLLVAELRKRGLEFHRIYGDTLSERIVEGAFLDFAGTNYFKTSQMQQVARLFFERKVNSGDIFFFSDIWFPGIDCIPYMSRLSGLDVKVVGIQHAGSWTPSDF